MAELPHPYSCDVCGIHKSVNNHWFRVWMTRENLIIIAPWNGHEISPRQIEERPIPAHFHCCGEEHALRKAGELLSDLKPTDAATLRTQADHAPGAERLPEVKPSGNDAD